LDQLAEENPSNTLPSSAKLPISSANSPPQSIPLHQLLVNRRSDPAAPATPCSEETLLFVFQHHASTCRRHVKTAAPYRRFPFLRRSLSAQPQKPHEPAPVYGSSRANRSSSTPVQKLPRHPHLLNPNPYCLRSENSSRSKTICPGCSTQTIPSSVPSDSGARSAHSGAHAARTGRDPRAAADVSPTARLSLSRAFIEADSPTTLKSVSAIEELAQTGQQLGIIISSWVSPYSASTNSGLLARLGKVAFLTSPPLFSCGWKFLEKNERYRLLGRTGIGGGWALFFFSTYAIYHVAAMHVLDSLTSIAS